jgi:hypothetical protein
MQKGKNLDELNLKDGDIVQSVYSNRRYMVQDSKTKLVEIRESGLEDRPYTVAFDSASSKAWVLEFSAMAAEETIKKWIDMSDKEQGALLLARHKGKIIQSLQTGGWKDCVPLWNPWNSYRVKPETAKKDLMVSVDGLFEKIGTIEVTDGKYDQSSIILS